MPSRSLLTALSLCALVGACTSQDKLPVQSSVPAPEKAAVDTLSAAALQKICTTHHVDASSRIFAAKKDGVVLRFSVTPSSRMADMGNLVFDAEGNYLGNDMGGELPWDDKAFMAAETERVRKLMAGAEIEANATPTACPDPRS